MVNNSFFRKTWAVTRYVIARILRVFSWCLMYTVILPLATMVLMTLFVLWKDNTTPGQLLMQEIEFVREVAPAGQFPVRDCSAVVDGKYTEPLNQRCTVIFTDAAMALFRKVQKAPEKITCIRVATADERLKEVLTEDASLPEKNQEMPCLFP